MKRWSLAVFGALVAPLLCAARFPEQARYDACVDLVGQNAAAAFSEGLAWLDQGGGVAARHCTALALSAMGKDEAAAEMFLEAASAAADGKGIGLLGLEMTPALLASLYAQAGNSYILANQPSHAIAPFTQALEQVIMTSPEAADISIDRARAAALTGDFDAAFEDLTTALGINAKDVDALLYRASAARQTQRYDVAKRDIQTLLDLRPDLPQAWLERGQLAIVMQKQDLARQSFIRTLELEDVGRVAETARYLLETLSLTP